ncbi:MAG TPA: type II toxin-antitoxin system RelE/ParE family toxin [Thermoanaerobaculia bacterium]|nr:type II toxin-antitoxin system RelE/ParE family toxin [Thermoanaerobaculia bacterium]
MRVQFRQSFTRDLRKLPSPDLLVRIKALIEQVEAAARLDDLPHLKKLAGGAGHYRVRLGDFRIGLEVERDLVTFVRVLHRKEIYRYFP